MRFSKRTFAASVLALVLAVPAIAEDDIKVDPAEMVKGIQKDVIWQVDDAAAKIIELAEVTPPAKYAYTPEKGVRTTGQVFLHVATANFMLPTFFGIKPPDGVDPMKLEQAPMTKEQTIETLRKSFAHVRTAIASVPDADLGQEIEFFGTKMSKQNTLLLLATHAHEHLGQSIAYARMNHIAPPWTARQEAAAAKQHEGHKH